MNHKMMHPPSETIETIQRLDAAACYHLIEPVVNALGGVEWAENSAEALARRASNIRALAEEVWIR